MRRIVTAVLTATLTLVMLASSPAVAAKVKQWPERKATVKQVASLVAKYRSDLYDDMSGIDSGCLVTTCTQIGRLRLTTLAAQARTLSIYLDVMDNRVKSNKDYLGTTPKVLITLVTRTKAALDDAAQQSLAVGNCLNAPPAQTCAGELGAAYATRLTLKQQLDAWSPYV